MKMIDWYKAQTPHAQSRIDDIPVVSCHCVELAILGLVVGFIIGLMI